MANSNQQRIRQQQNTSEKRADRGFAARNKDERIGVPAKVDSFRMKASTEQSKQSRIDGKRTGGIHDYAIERHEFKLNQ